MSSRSTRTVGGCIAPPPTAALGADDQESAGKKLLNLAPSQKQGATSSESKVSQMKVNCGSGTEKTELLASTRNGKCGAAISKLKCSLRPAGVLSAN